LHQTCNPFLQEVRSRIGLTRESEIRRLSAAQPVSYVAFDLIYCDGFDLMPAVLTHGKALLKDILDADTTLKFSEHVVGDGEKLFGKIQKSRMEGVIAKLTSSPYVQKRSRDWLKIKTVLRQEVV